MREVCGEQILVAEGKENIDFTNIISISGSLWYDGLVEWMKEQALSPRIKKVCMLLGEKEKNAKEKRMATVEERTQTAAIILKEKTQASVTFELVEGTHFSPIMPRLERAFEIIEETVTPTTHYS